MDTESWTHGNTPAQYGAVTFSDLFSPRQLLCHGTAVEIYRALLESEEAKGPLAEPVRSAFAYLALSLDKLRDYNSRMARWHNQREVMVNTFDRHDFAFKASYAEMAPLIVGLGYDWATEQTAKCIGELVDLVRPDIDVKVAKKDSRHADLFGSLSFVPPPLTITCKSGDSLDHLADGSVDLVVMDPPYYDNVMYAELSDFFYGSIRSPNGLCSPGTHSRHRNSPMTKGCAWPGWWDWTWTARS
jgi:putative DNA methylase